MRLLNPLRSPETCDQSLANQMPWSAHLANQRWARLRRHLPPIKHSGMRGHLLFLTGWLPHFLSNIWRIPFSNDRYPLHAQPGLVTTWRKINGISPNPLLSWMMVRMARRMRTLGVMEYQQQFGSGEASTFGHFCLFIWEWYQRDRLGSFDGKLRMTVTFRHYGSKVWGRLKGGITHCARIMNLWHPFYNWRTKI